MNRKMHCFVRAALVVSACFTLATQAAAQTIVLDPSSASLPGIPATSGDLLAPTPPLGAVPGPVVVGMAAARLGLVAGDVIDGLSFFDDAGPGATLYFTVSRASVGAPFAAPEVASEATLVPPGFQPEASSDIFSVFDPASGIPPGAHTQVLDGDGVPLTPLPIYPGFGLGLSEVLAAPGPPLVDAINALEWSAPGKAAFCAFLSLAAGSPTLTPGGNPLLPGGAEPGDILVACPGFPPFLGIAFPVSSSGLVSGGPGCAPPACDDVDALSIGVGLFVSLAPGSPSLVAIPASPADVVDFGTGMVVLPAVILGLAPTDDVTGLEIVANPCPVSPGTSMDFDDDGIDTLCITPDNCPSVFNPGQNDFDGDGAGDECDTCTDLDGDGLGNPGFPANLCPVDLCPVAVDPTNTDTDGDGVGDVCDNCPMVSNPDQIDTDFDGFGDACDTCTDFDGDGFGLTGEPCGADNCPFLFNPGQADGDGDGVGDDCDNCIATPNTDQADADFDSLGNACDNCPVNANFAQTDGDGDGVGDACDICTSGVAVTKPGLQLKKLGTAGSEGIAIKGTAAFPGAVPLPPVDVSTLGMRVQVVDLGNAGNVVVDHTIPGGMAPNACGPKDGWKENGPGTSEKFSTKTDSIPPGCLAGSSQGITKAGTSDKTAAMKGVKHKVQGKTGTFSPVIGPFRVAVVYGGGAEGAAGQCSETNYAPAECSLNGSGTTMKCKQ